MQQKLSLFSFVVVFVVCLLQTTATYAQSSYVTDDFEIMFRVGPDVQSKIIRSLSSGTSLTVLEEDAGNGHSQVQASDGQIGYVLTRFVSQAVPAKIQLNRLQARLETLTSDPSDARYELADVQESNRLLIEENMRFATQLKQAQDRIKTIESLAGTEVELSEDKARLQDEVQTLLLQLDDYRIQNETLRDTTDNKTRLITLAIVCVGIFLGWILSLAGAQRRSRSSW